MDAYTHRSLTTSDLSMPQFVPVVDDETPRQERRKGHVDVSVPPVDRGWEQGQVGWGVQGSFGSRDKDSVAQGCVHRVKTESKMVKNEKGLWVKVKTTGGGSGPMGRGGGGSGPMGRGGGVPLFNSMQESSLDGPVMTSYDPHDYVSHSKKRTMVTEPDHASTRQEEHGRHRDTHNKRRNEDYEGPSRGRSRSCSRERTRRRDRSQNKGYRRRDRSHSGERHRRRNRSGSREKRSRRDRSRSRDRHRRQGRSRSREKHRRRDRSDSGERRRLKTTERTDKVEDYRRVCKSPIDNAGEEYEESNNEDRGDTEEIAFTFTAVQIVNRFLEVFSSPVCDSRSRAMEELFSQLACIASLKSNVVHLDGKEAICKSLLSAARSDAIPSKRVFVHPDEESEGDKTPQSFCLDFHRAGQSPALGDQSKPTVLLYQCDSRHIIRVWGAVDKENISNRSGMTARDVYGSQAWEMAWRHISNAVPSIDKVLVEEECAHFHDYDSIDVWG